MGELRDPSRMKPDDGERTSRVRALEKELDGALTENQVSSFTLVHLLPKYKMFISGII